jgi:hypothetical protein
MRAVSLRLWLSLRRVLRKIDSSFPTVIKMHVLQPAKEATFMFLLRSKGLIRQAVVTTALFSATLGFAATIGSHTARQLVTRPVDETSLVTLQGNTRAAAQVQANERGVVADDFPLKHMLLQLKRSPEQEAALGKLMDQLHTPGNANYHHWLSEEEWDSKFGVNQRDVQTVVAWLQSHGFTVSGVLPDGMMIDFSGNASMVREAFHTEIHNVELPNGEKHFSNVTDPMIPAALADVVVGPTALNNFKPHSLRASKSHASIDATGKVHANYSFPTSDGHEYYAITPGDAQTIYNIKPLLEENVTGAGQTIGLVEDGDAYDIDSNGTSSDWKTFVSTFGLTKYGGTQTTVHPSGPIYCTAPGDTSNGDDVEVALDIEYASATAPGANVVVESCQDSYTGFGGLIAIENLVSAATITTPVLSLSYGECEAANGAANNAAFSYAYQHGAARGISIFVSSGDESSRSCDAHAQVSIYGIATSGYATTPYNVAVGGTDFSDVYSNTANNYWSATNNTDYSSAKDYVPEIPWNNSCASQLISTKEGFPTSYGAGSFCNSAAGAANDGQGDYYFITQASASGGPSNCFSGTAETSASDGTCAGQPKPSWQKVNGNPADGVRDIPDVSLFASSGIWSHYFVLCAANPNEVYTDGTAPCTGPPSTWAGEGGTSGASPMMAGIQTLINQYTNQSAGNPNYMYYKIAAAQYAPGTKSSCTISNETNSCAFHDVTLGDINTPCSSLVTETGQDLGLFDCYGLTPDPNLPSNFPIGVGSISNTKFTKSYTTSTGWDFATGIGSVNALNLAKAFKAASPGGASVVATVAVSGDTSSYVFGHGPASINYTITVTGNSTYPTGTVTLANGGTVIGTATLQTSAGCSTGGSCTESATIPYAPGTLAVGKYTVVATYSTTNENYSPASGNTALTVVQAGSVATTTTLVATPSTLTAGTANISLTATVTSASGKPTGTVAFTLSSVPIGSCTLSGGTCTVSTSSSALSAGNHGVTATYSGSATYASSAAIPAIVKLNASTTTTALTVSPEAVVTGATAVLSAKVARPAGNTGIPSGKVTFYSGTSVLGSASLNSEGVAELDMATTGLAVKSYSISAVYAGDAADTTSASSTVVLTIEPSYTETTVTSSSSVILPYSSATITATVARICCGTGRFTGTVTFSVASASGSSEQLGTATVRSAGVATFQVNATGLYFGGDTITATYAGDAADRSSSGTVNVTVY